MTTNSTAIDWLDNELQKEMTIEHTPVRSYVVIPLDTYMNRKSQAKNMEKDQMEISDEEIEKASKYWRETTNPDMWTFKLAWISGAKWYREQLKQRQ